MVWPQPHHLPEHPEASAARTAKEIDALPVETHRHRFPLLREWVVPHAHMLGRPRYLTSIGSQDFYKRGRRSGSRKACLDCGEVHMLVDLGYGLGWIKENYAGEGLFDGAQLG